MKVEKEKRLLSSRMLEYLAGQVEKSPERGKIKPFFVCIDYPKSGCEGVLFYENDLTDPTEQKRRIRVAMRKQGCDRLVSHYLFKGTREECVAWMKDEQTLEILLEEFAQLKEDAMSMD